MDNKYSIDRIEGDLVVIQDLNNEEIINEEITLFPKNIKEGMIVIKNNGEYIIDEQTTTEKKEEIKNRFDNLLN